VKTKTVRRVAILGTRYGNLALEERILGGAGIALTEAPGQSEAEIVTTASEAQVIVCGGAPKITAAVIRRLPHLRAVVRSGIGVDTVDVAACTRRHIYVVNVPDYCIDEVAIHALTLILSWARKIPVAQANTRGGKWEVAPLKPLQSPPDLVVGIVGFGRIAQRVCRMALDLGFRVWVSDPYVAKSRIAAKGARPVAFRPLLRRADFLSLHVPLTPKTRHMMNAGAFGLMRPSAYLINTARGELIDEAALYDALSKGSLAGAALDVMENEPPPSEHPLRSLANVILTPHCAWYTERSQQELRRKTCAEVMRVLRGDIPKNLVNKEALR
jgi:D-3-phosphoglycerate dehydrogenase